MSQATGSVAWAGLIASAVVLAVLRDYRAFADPFAGCRGFCLHRKSCGLYDKAHAVHDPRYGGEPAAAEEVAPARLARFNPYIVWTLCYAIVLPGLVWSLKTLIAARMGCGCLHHPACPKSHGNMKATEESPHLPQLPRTHTPRPGKSGWEPYLQDGVESFRHADGSCGMSRENEAYIDRHGLAVFQAAIAARTAGDRTASSPSSGEGMNERKTSTGRSKTNTVSRLGRG